jgi:hypothetical protein
MKTIKLKCDNCGQDHEKPLKEYNRRVRRGKNKFYCCQACATVDTKTKHTAIVRECLWCKNQFESTTHKNHKKCCSKLCANRVSHSFVDNKKLSKTMKEKFIRGEIRIPSANGFISVREIKQKIARTVKKNLNQKRSIALKNVLSK